MSVRVVGGVQSPIVVSFEGVSTVCADSSVVVPSYGRYISSVGAEGSVGGTV